MPILQQRTMIPSKHCFIQFLYKKFNFNPYLAKISEIMAESKSLTCASLKDSLPGTGPTPMPNKPMGGLGPPTWPPGRWGKWCGMWGGGGGSPGTGPIWKGGGCGPSRPFWWGGDAEFRTPFIGGPNWRPAFSTITWKKRNLGLKKGQHFFPGKKVHNWGMILQIVIY